MDKLQGMSVFVKAVETGSFSATADAMEMSPQLVGKQVQALEEHLGVKLLSRTTRRQHLTEIGAQFYERAKIILEEVAQAEGLAAETQITPRGKLRINAPVTFGIHALSLKLPDYLRAYPDVSLDLTLSNRFVDVIDEGFDAVFRVGELEDSGLVARPLAPYRLVLCASPDYLRQHAPIHSPQDLTDHECLGFSLNALRKKWTFNGPNGPITVPISGRLMVDSGEALLAAARAGLGLLLQPMELVQPELDAGRLVQLLPDYAPPTRPLHLVYTPDRRMTPKLRSFVDFALEAFGG
ncbi:LysR family transcriptional regulator [Marinimicrobium sp. LS-A18]|uniref:LysR family transcriptional regulator n=1 Tax=Marinimicrobium sp. LS-A18 TaxID=1381596 RepID=UPI000463990B|nr:LysR family transcriptional regulator [Marinimicrobium sp. LS-A18]